MYQSYIFLKPSALGIYASVIYLLNTINSWGLFVGLISTQSHQLLGIMQQSYVYLKPSAQIMSNFYKHVLKMLQDMWTNWRNLPSV